MNEKKPLSRTLASDATTDGSGASKVTPQIGLWGAVAIGIGGMVGGGIVAVKIGFKKRLKITVAAMMTAISTRATTSSLKIKFGIAGTFPSALS